MLGGGLTHVLFIWAPSSRLCRLARTLVASLISTRLLGVWVSQHGSPGIEEEYSFELYHSLDIILHYACPNFPRPRTAALEKANGGVPTPARASLSCALLRTMIEDLSEQADVAVGSIYAHFGSKDGVYAALIDRALELDKRYSEEGLTPATCPWSGW